MQIQSGSRRTDEVQMELLQRFTACCILLIIIIDVVPRGLISQENIFQSSSSESWLELNIFNGLFILSTPIFTGFQHSGPEDNRRVKDNNLTDWICEPHFDLIQIEH